MEAAMQADSPIYLLVHAQNDSRRDFLQEARLFSAFFSGWNDKGLIEVVTQQVNDPKDLSRVIKEFVPRLAVLHLALHKEDLETWLEDLGGWEMLEMAPLALLFVNATHSTEQENEFAKFSSSVISVYGPLPDFWLTFPNDFYRNLTSGMQLGEAFDLAVSNITRNDESRAASKIQVQQQKSRSPGPDFPYRLKVRNRRVSQWDPEKNPFGPPKIGEEPGPDQSNIQLLEGDMFEAPEMDLLVIPRANETTLQSDMTSRIGGMGTVPPPEPGIKAGECEGPFEWSTDTDGKIRQLCYANSVGAGRSRPDMIASIGRRLGAMTQEHAEIRRVVSPLLGTGTGNLEPITALRYLFYSFLDTAHPEARLLIYINDHGVFEQLQQNFPPTRPADVGPTGNMVFDFSTDVAEGTDLLDITGDVNAFANLLVFRELKLPLSIGLFGDWGSGKSFFMNKLQESVDQQVSYAETELNDRIGQKMDEFQGLDLEGKLEKLRERLSDPQREASRLAQDLIAGQPAAVYRLRELMLADAASTDSSVNRERAILSKARQAAPNTPRSKADEELKALKAEEAVLEKMKALENEVDNRAFELIERLRDNSPSDLTELVNLLERSFAKEIERRESKYREEPAQLDRDYERLLLESEAADLDRCRRVAQITFNAWHYIDSNLWASLLTHIFEQLSIYMGNRSPEEMREIELFDQLASTQQMKREAHLAQNNLRQRKINILEEIRRLEEEKEKARQSLSDLKLKEVLTELEKDEDVKQLREEVEALDAVKQVRADIATITDTITYFQTLTTYLKSTWNRVEMLINSLFRKETALLGWVGLGVLILGGVLAIFAIRGNWIDNITEIDFVKYLLQVSSVTASIMTFAKGAGVLINNGLDEVNKALDVIEARRSQLEALATRQYEAKLTAQRLELKNVEEELEKRYSQLSATQEEERDLMAEIKEIESGRKLSAFISRRLASGDYQQYLGLISLVRRDCERLTRFLHNEENWEWERNWLDLEAREKEQSSLIRRVAFRPHHKIDRIVLYIDDLDRCPPEKVVEVLQAVHLILAFPLFVVVVGVDVRWIYRSLVKNYGDLLGRNEWEMVLRASEEGQPGTKLFALEPQRSDPLDAFEEELGGHASPFDYLEKIFQIPFRLRRMTPTSTRNFLSNLLGEADEIPEEQSLLPGEPSETEELTEEAATSTPEIEDSAQSEEPLTDEGAEQEISQAPVEPSDRPKPTALGDSQGMERIRLSKSEKEFIVGMAALVGNSPRNVKRFVNICRMIKSHESWIYEDHISPGERFRQIVFLMAMAVGCPGIAPSILERFEHPEEWGAEGNTLIGTFQPALEPYMLDDLDDSEQLRDEWDTLRDFLADMATNSNPDIQQLTDWSIQELRDAASVASRFTFRLIVD